MNNKILFATLLIGILSITTISAQIHNEQVNIIAPYEPSVNDANKINFDPDKYNIVIDKTKPIYDLTTFQRNLNNKIPEKLSLISPPTYEDKIKQHILSAILGFGTNLEPLIDININSNQNAKTAGGFHIYHNSAWRQMKDIPDNSFNTTLFNGYGSFTLGKQKIVPSISFSHNTTHYYAVNKEYPNFTQLNPNDSIQQTTDILEADIALYNAKYSKLNYKINLRYSYLQDIKKYKEHEISLPVDINIYPKWIMHDIINIGFYSNYYISSQINHDNFLINLSPTYFFSTEVFDFKIGFDISLASINRNNIDYLQSNNDNKNTKNVLYFHPIAGIKVNIIPQTFNIHIGVTGNSKRNTFKSLYLQNPYIASPAILNQPLYYEIVSDSSLTFQSYITNTKYNFYAGFDSKIGKNINLSTNVEYKIINDLPLFVSEKVFICYYNDELYSPIYSNEFIIRHANINQLSISAEFTMNTKKGFRFNLHGQYNINKLQDKNQINEIYNIPNYELYFNTKYTFNNKKLSLLLEAYSIGQRKDKNFISDNLLPNNNIILKPVTDMSISAIYMFNNTFSTWVSLNNIFHYSKKSGLWNHYYEYPFNIMLGVSISM